MNTVSETSNAEGKSVLDDNLSNGDESDLIADLRQEYEILINALREGNFRRDPALSMQLTVLMFDLGLYQPSPP